MNQADGHDNVSGGLPPTPAGAPFVVDIDGYEGPIDVLLGLARQQKVDLAQLSILQLADQYLEFVAKARRVNLELAADYLVMAAWLAYLKSKMLLPELDKPEEPTGDEMAAALQFQLRRLEAMQDAGAKLMVRPRLNRDFFPRGMPEVFAPVIKSVIDVTLYDLLRAYGTQIQRKEASSTLHIEPWTLFTVDDALDRLRSRIGTTPDWSVLWQYLPDDLRSPLATRSAVATTFAASLELCKQGRVKIRQGNAFGPIYLRAATASEAKASAMAFAASDPATDLATMSKPSDASSKTVEMPQGANDDKTQTETS